MTEMGPCTRMSVQSLGSNSTSGRTMERQRGWDGDVDLKKKHQIGQSGG